MERDTQRLRREIRSRVAPSGVMDVNIDQVRTKRQIDKYDESIQRSGLTDTA